MTQHAQLGDVADIVRGIAFPKEARSLESLPGHVACLRTTNVQRQVEWGDLWFVPVEHVRRDEQFVRAGDILISTANSYELVGKVAPVVGVPHKATLGAFISLIRAREGVEPKYLYHQLAWSKTQARIREMASTTTNISNVSTKKLALLDLHVPPLAEQRLAVAELEKQFSRLDEAVANLQRVKANLARYVAGVRAHAVQGALASLADAPNGGELPVGWRWSTIGELAKIGTGATPSRGNASYYDGGTIPWVTSTVVNHPFVVRAAQFVTPLALSKTNLTLYPPGDVACCHVRRRKNAWQVH